MVYKNEFGVIPPLAQIIYGRMNLMTTKYCPLKRFKECGNCNKNSYYLKDDFGKFLIYHEGCITHIVNEKPLYLIDEIDEIQKYVKTLRIDFTVETKDEVIKIINDYNKKISGDNTKRFNKDLNTRGLFKREIL